MPNDKIKVIKKQSPSDTYDWLAFASDEDVKHLTKMAINMQGLTKKFAELTEQIKRRAKNTCETT